MPSLASSSAIVVVVRRDQRKPVMGSPAVSCSSRPWRTAVRSGFFSRRSSTHAGAARSAADHILIQQLLPTPGDGMHVQAQEVAEQSVPAMAQADGLQPGKPSALLFIEQAIEQQDGSLEFMGRSLRVSGMDGHRDSLSGRTAGFLPEGHARTTQTQTGPSGHCLSRPSKLSVRSQTHTRSNCFTSIAVPRNSARMELHYPATTVNLFLRDSLEWSLGHG